MAIAGLSSEPSRRSADLLSRHRSRPLAILCDKPNQMRSHPYQDAPTAHDNDDQHQRIEWNGISRNEDGGQRNQQGSSNGQYSYIRDKGGGGTGVPQDEGNACCNSDRKKGDFDLGPPWRSNSES